MKNFKNYPPFLVIYLVYLLYIPRLIGLNINCLNPRLLGVQEYSQKCDLVVVLDYFIKFALGGYFAVIFGSYLYFKPKIRPHLAFAVILAALTIFAYYRYMPIAWQKINAAPIYLDSLYN